MTEYWVSQANKWCDFCKIFISHNPISIRNHELGKRHKDNVAKRLETMQKDGKAKEKEQIKAAQALQQIEAKAKKSYQKDLAAFQEAGVSSSSNTVESNQRATPGNEWEFDTSSGYYYNKSNSFYYDKTSDLFYSDSLGKWVSLQEASKSAKVTKPDFTQNSSNNPSKSTIGVYAPGPVISKQLNPMRDIKGATSAVAVNKRKREDQMKPKKKLSKEEEEALKAREAARKRVEAREKPLMGLYRNY
ncbi:hypothetical protein LUZ60_001241 [Juncus effusus]|nr:hypothetical protein LUZ60_001241 [Juncus effusus]